jgi:hypothetical protein
MWINARLLESDVLLKQLLDAPCYKFDDDLEKKIPIKHGIYAISKCGSEAGEYLHAGISKKGANGLKGRVWEQHYKVGGSSGDLVEKVKNKESKSAAAAREWIKLNCQVQYITVEDAIIRGWAEHYVLSVLRPIWGH